MIRSAIALAACALAGGATAATAAVWNAPVQVSDRATEYPWSRPDLAVAPDGGAALAWQRSFFAPRRRFVEIARRATPGGRFGEPVVADFGSEPFAGPVVAAASGGRALLLWARQGGATAQPRALGYGLPDLPSAPAEFGSTTRIVTLRAGLGGARRQLLWRGSGGPLTFVSGSSGAWTVPADLAPAATADAFAQAPDGATITAWVAGGRLQAVTGAEPPADLGPADGTPGVAVARGGRALVVWCSAGVVRVAERSGSAWSASRPVGDGAAADDCALAPSAAMTADGASVAAWRARAGGRLEVRAARRLAGGDWLAARRLGRGPRNVGAPVAVVGPGGAALVAWSHPLGTSGALIATRSAPAAAWGPRADVGVRGFRAALPDLGVDASGRVTLAFLALPNGTYARGLRVMAATRRGALR